MSASASSSTSKAALVIVGVILLLGLVLVGFSVISGGGDSLCPPGTVWSAAHQHCH